MARPLRMEYPGAYYHVMNRGQGRQVIYRDRNHYQVFLDVLGRAAEIFNVKIYAFSLMANHYHLLIQTPEGNISRFMRHLNGVYTQKFNRLVNRDGSLFRGRYKSIVIEKDSYFLELIRYIHLNPVRAQVVSRPQDHRWTSHRVYLGRSKKLLWLEVGEVLNMFARTKQSARRALHDFVKSGMNSDLEKKLRQKKWPGILGSKKFIERLKNLVKVDYEVPLSKEAQERGTTEKWVQATAQVYGIKSEELSNRRRGEASAPRAIAAFMAREQCGAVLEEISKTIGGVTTRGVSHLVKRGALLADTEEGQKVVRKIIKYYNET